MEFSFPNHQYYCYCGIGMIWLDRFDFYILRANIKTMFQTHSETDLKRVSVSQARVSVFHVPKYEKGLVYATCAGLLMIMMYC
jgi:hypothetical protein